MVNERPLRNTNLNIILTDIFLYDYMAINLYNRKTILFSPS